MPQIALAELGFGDVGTGLWHALYAPTATPAEIQDKLFDAIQTAMKSERMADLYRRSEAESVPLSSRAESKIWLKTNMERFIKLIKEVGAEAK